MKTRKTGQNPERKKSDKMVSQQLGPKDSKNQNLEIEKCYYFLSKFRI